MGPQNKADVQGGKGVVFYKITCENVIRKLTLEEVKQMSTIQTAAIDQVKDEEKKIDEEVIVEKHQALMVRSVVTTPSGDWTNTVATVLASINPLDGAWRKIIIRETVPGGTVKEMVLER